MNIVSELKLNGMRLAYCIGDDIPAEFSCKKINVADKTYNVLRAGSSKSLSGKMNALMQLQIRDDEEMPVGEFRIIQ